MDPIAHPRIGHGGGGRGAPDGPPDAGAVKEQDDVIYGRKADLALTMDVFTPKKDANGAAIIVVVSGGWVSDREGFAPFSGPLVKSSDISSSIRIGKFQFLWTLSVVIIMTV